MNSVFYYPAVFQKEDVGYSVWIPDIQGCISQGDTFDEAMEYIKDAIGICLDLIVQNGNVPPKATEPNGIELEHNQFLAVVSFDFDEYQKKHGEKSVNEKRKDEKNIVIMSLEQYNSIMKATRNAEYLAKLDRSMEQLSQGNGTVHELIEVEDE
ncbi:MAG: type II toxin-antitoxin system HicB family antitoxin [Ruminococcus sp.]|nr:type II toxin-antitoxin system HicB family antitoxin [Ruminococcus sp.]